MNMILKKIDGLSFYKFMTLYALAMSLSVTLGFYSGLYIPFYFG